MKKRYVLLLCAFALSASLFGCGNSKDSSESAQTEQSSSAQDDAGTVITGYLVDNADKYVTLGTYKGLEVEQPVYTASDEDVSMEIENTLYEYSTAAEVDRAAQSGDTLTVDLTATIEGESKPNLTETDYIIELGYEEFGSDFDEKLTGSKTGDTLEFSCSYQDDTWYDDWTDKTVHFKVTVKKIEENTIPEYTDDFVSTLGYDSKDAFEAALKEQIQASYDEQSTAETRENVISTAMDACQFNGYPDKLYDSCKSTVEEQYSAFAEMTGMTLDDLYEAYDMSDDDIREEVMSTVNRRLFISALCQKEGLSVDTAEYSDYLDNNCYDYGFDDGTSFEENYGKENIMWMLYEQKAAAYLLLNAEISKTPVSTSEEDVEISDTDDETDEEILDGLDDSAAESGSEAVAETDTETEQNPA